MIQAFKEIERKFVEEDGKKFEIVKRECIDNPITEEEYDAVIDASEEFEDSEWSALFYASPGEVIGFNVETILSQFESWESTQKEDIDYLKKTGEKEDADTMIDSIETIREKLECLENWKGYSIMCTD